MQSRNTAPEMRLRKALWARGCRYRLHAHIPGSPDIVFAAARLAVFVDGCFWHGCPEHYTAPVANSEFWRMKLERNVSRDRSVDRTLATAGWKVLRFWEHEIDASLPLAVDMVVKTLARSTVCSADENGVAPDPYSA